MHLTGHIGLIDQGQLFAARGGHVPVWYMLKIGAGTSSGCAMGSSLSMAGPCTFMFAKLELGVPNRGAELPVEGVMAP